MYVIIYRSHAGNLIVYGPFDNKALAETWALARADSLGYAWWNTPINEHSPDGQPVR